MPGKYKKNHSFKKKRRGGHRNKRLRIKPGADGKLKKVFQSIGSPAPRDFKPDPFQLEALEATQRSDCLVTAPTGSGKTWIAVEAIKAIHDKGGRAWYAFPLKALTNSKYTEFGEFFGPDQVGILTGDRKENPDAPIIVGTTEILRNQLYDSMSLGKDLNTDFVVLDEAHYLGDADRGVVWEEVMIYLPRRTPLLLLSATIGNAREIADWLYAIRGQKCQVVEERKRQVPLYPLFFHPSGTLYPLLGDNGKKIKKQLHKKVRTFLDLKYPPVLSSYRKPPPYVDMLNVLKRYRLAPTIFFLKSRADCDTAVEQFPEDTGDTGSDTRIGRRIREFVEKHPHIEGHRHLGRLEHSRVGSHHSGQLPAWKLLLETLMTEGLLRAVFATSTVAAGVNFPARTVVFFNSDKFNGTEFLPLDPTEFHQMTGRAGRRGMDKIGFALAAPGKFMDVRLMAKLTHTPASPVLSQIKINFSMTLNLLLSHTPGQVEDLLENSFATFLMEKEGTARRRSADILKKEFTRRLSFLKETGYVGQKGELTEDGIWASQLRVDQPLLIAEGIRQGVFPHEDPALLAAVITAFVNERESDDRFDKDDMPQSVLGCMLTMRNGLQPFATLMSKRGFEPRQMFIRPSVSIFKWASGEPWDAVVKYSQMAEGDFAMLVLRTADNLRHMRALGRVFPKVAGAASLAIDLMLREPVVTE